METLLIFDLAPSGVGEPDAGWYILFPSGKLYAGPYKREKDAKGQLTRLRKGYTPAARKV